MEGEKCGVGMWMGQHLWFRLVRDVHLQEVRDTVFVRGWDHECVSTEERRSPMGGDCLQTPNCMFLCCCFSFSILN